MVPPYSPTFDGGKSAAKPASAARVSAGGELVIDPG